MNPMELNLSPQLMLPYIPPWNISTQCSAWRLFGSPAFQRQFPVPFGWFLQAFVSLDQHHLCEKYLKPMNHRLLLSAVCWSDVMLVVIFLKYPHSSSVCMETRPSWFLLLQYWLASSQLTYLKSKWYWEQTCSTYSECTVKGGKTAIDIYKSSRRKHLPFIKTVGKGDREELHENRVPGTGMRDESLLFFSLPARFFCSPAMPQRLAQTTKEA